MGTVCPPQNELFKHGWNLNHGFVNIEASCFPRVGGGPLVVISTVVPVSRDITPDTHEEGHLSGPQNFIYNYSSRGPPWRVEGETHFQIQHLSFSGSSNSPALHSQPFFRSKKFTIRLWISSSFTRIGAVLTTCRWPWRRPAKWGPTIYKWSEKNLINGFRTLETNLPTFPWASS